MCSVQGDSDEEVEDMEHLRIRDEKLIDTSNICSKCANEGILIKVNKRQAECKNCFLSHIQHKFRATLGASKILPRGANILIVFDGSSQSILLLDVLYTAIGMSTYKKLQCNAKVLFINKICSRIKPDDLEYNLSILQKYKFDVFISESGSTSYPDRISNNKAKILNLLNSEKLYSTKISSETSKIDYLSKIRLKTIQYAARHLNCEYILFGDISKDLATSFLINVSLGRGASVALDTALLDNRLEDAKILRPIKDITQEEMEKYLELKGFRIPEMSISENNPSLKVSLQSLTNEFVQNLQIAYPATVSTVFRTSNKISTKPYKNGQRCSFCSSQIESSFQIEKNLKNTNLSIFELNLSDLDINSLCYGCKNIYLDIVE